MPRLLVSTRKGLFTLERDGGDAGWSVTGTSFLGDNCTLARHDARSGRTHVALDHGHFGVKLHRSNDGDRTWKEIAAPAYPPRPEGSEPEIDPMGRPLPEALKLVWALVPGGADQPGRLWCGTIPGGLFRSDDDGDSWQFVDSLWNEPGRKKWFGGGADWPGIHSVCVDPRNSRRVLVGVSCGGVWLTEDDGATWENRAQGMRAEYMPPERAYDVDIQDPHMVVQCPAQPERLWAQHHNGVFRSTDDCTSWEEITGIEPSTFGFAVAVHPADGDTAWLIPGIDDQKRIPVDGRLVVTRTRDGGRTWETLRRGLPQEHAYDIVFRHALDIDETGSCLAFGTTTGALFVSENGGDDWQAVSRHLPPVYAVCFCEEDVETSKRRNVETGR